MTIGSLSLTIGEKSDYTPQIRKKSAKKAVKVAKKPILREKCAAGSVQCAVQKDPRGGIENFGGKIGSFTAGCELAKIAGSKGGKTTALKNALRRDLEMAAAKGDRLAKIYDKALDSLDLDLMTLCEKAAKLVGATFDQSPDAKQRVELDGKVEQRNITINFRKAVKADAE